jgi:hypothetical protein
MFHTHVASACSKCFICFQMYIVFNFFQVVSVLCCVRPGTSRGAGRVLRSGARRVLALECRLHEEREERVSGMTGGRKYGGRRVRT